MSQLFNIMQNFNSFQYAKPITGRNAIVIILCWHGCYASVNTIQLDTSLAGSLCELPLAICEPFLLVSLCSVNVVDFLFQPYCLSLNLCFCSQLACLCAKVYVIGYMFGVMAGLLPYSFVNNSAVLKIRGDHGRRISGCSSENFWLIFVYFWYPDCKLNLRC